MASNIISKIEEIFIRLKEMRDKVVTVVEAVQEKMDKPMQRIETMVENQQISKTDVEAVQEEIAKISQEFEKTIVEIMDKMAQEVISAVRNEMNSLGSSLADEGDEYS